jgi:hypothetical protein
MIGSRLGKANVHVIAYSVQAGQNDVAIGRLPLVLEGDSIRVEAETRSRTQLLTVFDVVHIPPSYSSSISYDKGTELETLNDQKAALEARVAVTDGQKYILEGYSESVKAGRITDLTNEQLEEFMDVYATRELKIYREKVRLQKEIEIIDTRVKDIRGKISSEEEEKRATGVTVVVLAEEDGLVDLILSYGEQTIRRLRKAFELIPHSPLSRSTGILVQLI